MTRSRNFKIVAPLTMLFVLVALVGLAFAAGPDGNFRKGKYLFRKHCRSCHVVGGQAADMSPADKPQAEWEKTFNDWQSVKCADEWKGLSDSDRKDIYTYMYDFAKDSPSPAKCS